MPVEIYTASYAHLCDNYVITLTCYDVIIGYIANVRTLRYHFRQQLAFPSGVDYNIQKRRLLIGKGCICMETQGSDLEVRDEYGFPLPYPLEVLEQMKQRLSISQEMFQNIHSYFDAANHLYARISLRMLFKIYNSQNPPVRQEDFLEAAEIIAHEKCAYTILSPEVFHEEAVPSQPMDQELVADHLYTVGDEYYYKLEEAQEGKPWYIPLRDTFLKYANSDHTEKTPQLQAMTDYLSNTQRKLHCPPMEIAEEFEMMLHMDESIQNIVEDGQRLGVCFQDQQELRTFVGLYLELSHHTRRYSLRGHTPAELGLPLQSVEEALKELTYDPNYQDPITNIAAILRGRIIGAPTISGKPAKNAPCSCGSGRKYKNCCGKGK